MNSNNNQGFDFYFAKYYEHLADTFINYRQAIESFKKFVTKTDSIFEIGTGTGHFAIPLHNEGYNISGIEPWELMLNRLKSECPDFQVKLASLQDYTFDSQYDFIVSHSSVFLLTRDEKEVDLIFESYIKSEVELLMSISKITQSLKPSGKFFINIQRNPPQVYLENGDSYEIAKIDYNLSNKTVAKKHLFSINKSGAIEKTYEKYATTFDNFRSIIESLSCQFKFSDDREWVIIEQFLSAI